MTQHLHDYVQAAIDAEDFKTMAVLEILGMDPLLAQLPLLSICGNAFTYAAHINDQGLQQHKIERLRIAGGDFDVALGQGTRRPHEQSGKIKALADYLVRSFVQGDSVADARHPIGLYHRVPHHHRFRAGVHQLDAVIAEVRDATNIITTQAVADTLPGLTYRFDRFGRRHAFYGDLDDPYRTALHVVIVPEPEEGQPHVPGRWLVVARLAEDGVVGMQNGAPEVSDLGLIKQKPDDVLPSIYRTRLEWLLAPGVFAANALARLELSA